MGGETYRYALFDLPTMQKLKAMGVDGLISDFPNLYKSLVNGQ